MNLRSQKRKKEQIMKNNDKLTRKVLVRPFKYITDSVALEATKMIVLLLLQVVLLFISKSYNSLLIVLAAVIGSLGADFFSHRLFHNEDNDEYSFIVSAAHGMITGLLIPSTYSPVTVVIATFFTMLIVKHFFGGFSYAWVNPAVFTVIVLWIIGARLFPSYLVNMDILSLRNPSQTLIENGTLPQYAFDPEITDALNASVFRLFKVSIPNGYVSLFWDNQSLIPAFRFNFITLLSSVVLFAGNFVKCVIPGIFLFVYILLVRFVSPLICNGVAFQGDMLLALLTGGTIFFAVFVLSWYGTVPISLSGKIIYGFFAGVAAFLIAGPGTSPCGLIFTVLVSNIFSIVIQQWESRRDRISLRKKLESFRKIEADELKEL